jgi:hypothetical protein
VSGRQLTREVRIMAQDRVAMHEGVIPVTASLGWTLIWPWEWQIEGTRAERAISSIWVACLILPFGYWAVYASRSPRIGRNRRLRALVCALGSVSVYAGLVLTPRVFGVSGAPASDLFAACGGLLVGAALSSGLALRTALEESG